MELSRNTMVRWVAEMADRLSPLYIALNSYVLEAGKVHADDTPVKVLAPGTRQQGEGGLSEDERAELKRLRKEIRELQIEKEILKKASAFFAKHMS